MGRLDDVITIVTGAGSGIGAAIARACAHQNAVVIVTDVDGAAATAVADEIRDAGGRAEAHTLDVTDTASVGAVVEAVMRAHGRIDVLVNNAGWDQGIPFLETDPDFWRRVIDINYVGVLTTCHAVVPHMVQAGGGRVINLGSDAGRVGSSGEAVYSGAKGAVIAFSKALAREVARHQVTVNAVCPGPTDTPLFQSMGDEEGKLRAALTKAIPLRRLGRPEDLANAVVFFASPEASFITGQTLSVSGGLTMS